LTAQSVSFRSPPETGGNPVTTTVSRRVRPGHEAEYEQVLQGLIAVAAKFPGHLGVEVFRPQTAGAGEYRTVYRFDTPEHLRAWLDSAERAAWLARAETHVIGPIRTSFVTGLETWFTLPSQPATPPPPPHKMALLTWVTIFPARVTRLLGGWLYPDHSAQPEDPSTMSKNPRVKGATHVWSN
jgi:uncharacterized protein